MPKLLQTVSESILGLGDLAIGDLDSLVGELSVGDIDFADLFFERAEAETYSLEDGEVKYENCVISGGTWLLHRRYWACADSTVIDSVWCPAGGTVELVLD